MTEILASLSRLHDVQNIFDIALVALVFYILLRFFHGTQAVQLLRGLVLIGVVSAVVSQLQ